MAFDLLRLLEKDKALETAAEMFEINGSLTDAVYLQEEAIKANFKNLELYKTMGKLNEKGVKRMG
jgi:hypothetical protein